MLPAGHWAVHPSREIEKYGVGGDERAEVVKINRLLGDFLV